MQHNCQLIGWNTNLISIHRCDILKYTNDLTGDGDTKRIFVVFSYLDDGLNLFTFYLELVVVISLHT